MVEAVLNGARSPEITGVESRLLTAATAQPEDLLQADGLIVATPENFGYMSGALKDFFDRSFYEVEGKLLPLPYAIHADAFSLDTACFKTIRQHECIASQL